MSLSNILLNGFKTLLLITLITTTAQAANHELQIGGGFGGAIADIDFGSGATDESSIEYAWRGFAGYRYKYIGVQIGYQDVGRYDAVVSSSGSTADASVEINAITAHLKFYWPLTRKKYGPYTYASVGSHWWEADAKSDSSSDSESGTDLSLGGGIGYRLEHIDVHLDWQYDFMDDEVLGFELDDINTVTLNVSFLFN